jgi:hypothetical protein
MRGIPARLLGPRAEEKCGMRGSIRKRGTYSYWLDFGYFRGNASCVE